ncbi:Ca2+-binding RTX toxin-like protein [Pseudoroseicyclus aestuarii]|uniref:Ca2+-binding RTX toxin-like protein n=2 Tax=Pseudoroseicyclus aestuarii TaxID=1795041 RepID=A0A318SLQ8_9RHOB|nr:Ca2+-binding RTX toxin-like protein [Pseudoroseicyclus aestuarii]
MANFTIASYDSRYESTAALTEVIVRATPNAVYGYNLGINNAGADGVGEIFTNPVAINDATFLKWRAVGNQIGNILHEVTHLNKDLDGYRNLIYEELSNSGTPVDQDVLLAIEEVLTRQVVATIDSQLPEWRYYLNRPTIEDVVESSYYGDKLTSVQKQALLTYFNSSDYASPTVVINGVQVGLSPEGRVISTVLDNGTIVPVEEPQDFGSQILSSTKELINGALTAARDIGNALARGAAAAVEAIGSIAHSVNKFLDDTVSYLTGNNDRDEGRSGDHDNGKPIVIDLDGDGVEINVKGDVSFDIDGDGYLERTAWASPDDGFLVIDLNADGTRGAGDGKIDQNEELILTEWVEWDGATDLQALATFDQWSSRGGNKDGKLSSADNVWSELRVWQDANQNGRVDSGELKTLSQLGISQINLQYDDKTGFSDIKNDVRIVDTVLLGSASYIRNGKTVVGGVGDVSLSYEAEGSRRVEMEGGYGIKFENGTTKRYAVLNNSGSANINLDTAALDGATGDARPNVLTAQGHSRSVQISGGGGNDTVRGGDNDDLLSGDTGADTIQGLSGNDTLYVDIEDLASGLVDGGEGQDTLVVVGSKGINISLDGLNIESFYSGDAADAIGGGALTKQIEIYGGAGNDAASGGSSDDMLSGDDGDDSLYGNDGDDVVLGGAGSDRIEGRNDDDLVSGGDGNDSVNGNNGDDIVSGGDGDDTLFGSDDDDVVDGGVGADTLYGGSGDDMLAGAEGNDALYFWLGDDTLMGGSGNDSFRLERTSEYGSSKHWGWAVFQGGTGSDTAYLAGSKSDWTIKTSVGPNQWQLARLPAANEKVVLDLQDIEKVVFGDGSSITLSTNSGSDRSDDYVRKNLFGAGQGDDVGTTSTDALNEDGVSYGWMGNDRISGLDGTSRIEGGSGQDALMGGGGNDTLTGDSGSDRLSGEEDRDTLYGGSGSDTLAGGDGDDRLDGKEGSDYLYGGKHDDVLLGGSGSDILVGGPDDQVDGDDTFYGGSGADRILAGAGTDRAWGGTGADAIYGGSGGDYLHGEDGSDQLDGGSGSDQLYGESGFDYLKGGSENDRLYGGDDDDALEGDDGSDSLYGGTGSDLLTGGAGADLVDGGAGILDFASYAGSAAAVTISLAAGTASGGDAAGDTLVGIESLIGSIKSDKLIGDALDNTLQGGLGDDTLGGNEGHDILIGDDGDDSLAGGDGSDTLFGGGGNDILQGHTGENQLFGGLGSDLMIAGAQAELFDGGGNHDRVSYSVATIGVLADMRYSDRSTGYAADDVFVGVEHLEGSNFDDDLRGTTFGNSIYGGQGSDILNGRSGDDFLFGGEGNDTLLGGSDADELHGGSGTDRAQYSEAEAGVKADLANPSANTGDAAGDTYESIENLQGSNFNDDLRGSSGGNLLSGAEGNDFLRGREGNDNIYGGEGDDVLFGGAGGDALYGSSGVDRAQYSEASVGVRADLQDDQTNTGEAIGDTYNSIENLYGSNYADTLLGDTESNTIWGGSGNDLLYGRAGADTVFGGDGQDTFYFRKGYEADRISDFQNDVDTIVLQGFGLSGVPSALSHATQSGSNVFFDFGGGDTLLVLNTQISALQNDIAV